MTEVACYLPVCLIPSNRHFCRGQSIINQFDTLCAILWYAGLHVVTLLLKIVKLWHLSIEFYGEWQLFATHHRTQYESKFDNF